MGNAIRMLAYPPDFPSFFSAGGLNSGGGIGFDIVRSRVVGKWNGVCPPFDNGSEYSSMSRATTAFSHLTTENCQVIFHTTRKREKDWRPFPERSTLDNGHSESNIHYALGGLRVFTHRTNVD
jgi:hypothetical protein